MLAKGASMIDARDNGEIMRTFHLCLQLFFIDMKLF
jgi:hypothetical protein